MLHILQWCHIIIYFFVLAIYYILFIAINRMIFL